MFVCLPVQEETSRSGSCHPHGQTSRIELRLSGFVLKSSSGLVFRRECCRQRQRRRRQQRRCYQRHISPQSSLTPMLPLQRWFPAVKKSERSDGSMTLRRGTQKYGNFAHLSPASRPFVRSVAWWGKFNENTSRNHQNEYSVNWNCPNSLFSIFLHSAYTSPRPKSCRRPGKLLQFL